MRRIRFRLTLVAGLLVVSGLLPAAASARSAASAMVRDAAARFERYGVHYDTRDLRAVDRGNGDVIVMPKASIHVGNGIDTRSGAGAAPATHSDRTASVAAASDWTLRNSACFARYGGSAAWMDTCFHWHQRLDDGSSTYDYHELHLFATASTTSSLLYLTSAWVESGPLGTTIQSWYDWDPGSDSDTSCRNESVGIQVGSVGISYAHDHCEMWDINKYATAGRFRNTWRGRVARSEREMAFDIAVRVAQGKTPNWSLNWDFATSIRV